MQVLRVNPRNSIVFFLDLDAGVLPDPATLGLHVVTPGPSGLAIQTYQEDDGETKISLGSSESILDPDLVLTWEGTIPSALGVLSIVDVHHAVLLSVESPELASVEVWTSDPVSEPASIAIVVL